MRRRLDLTRPVEREVLEQCLRLAQQAPTAIYGRTGHFVVVTDRNGGPCTGIAGKTKIRLH